MKKKTATFLQQMSPTKLKSPGSYESADSKIGLRQCHTDSKFSKNPQKTKEKTIKKIVKAV